MQMPGRGLVFVFEISSSSFSVLIFSSLTPPYPRESETPKRLSDLFITLVLPHQSSYYPAKVRHTQIQELHLDTLDSLNQ